MTRYELKPGSPVIVQLDTSDRAVEISFSGRLKWELIDGYSNSRVLRTGFINEGTYLIELIPELYNLQLKIESREFGDLVSDLYVTRL